MTRSRTDPHTPARVPVAKRRAATDAAHHIGPPAAITTTLLPLAIPFVVLLSILGAQSAGAIQITLDYRFDSAGFFAANPAAQSALEAAADLFEQRLTDGLDAIVPDADNTWNMYFYRPDTDALGEWVTNPTVPANTLWIFVGARDLPEGTLGEASSGGFSASGYAPWLDTLDTRGEPNAVGPGATDFGPWGGGIAFDLDADGVGWHFDHTAPVTPNASDFYSVAMHELAHVLGIGVAESWDRLLQSNAFVGAHAVGSHGAPVPMADGGHWADTVMSTANGQSQKALMTPFLADGTRTDMTDLDWAALADIGWVVTPQTVPGDLNGDRLVNTEDINPFVLALTNAAGFAAAWPDVDRLAAGDINGDGNLDTEDINPFVAALTGGANAGAPAVIPEPATLILLLALTGVTIRSRQARQAHPLPQPGDPAANRVPAATP